MIPRSAISLTIFSAVLSAKRRLENPEDYETWARKNCPKITPFVIFAQHLKKQCPGMFGPHKTASEMAEAAKAAYLRLTEENRTEFHRACEMRLERFRSSYEEEALFKPSNLQAYT